jgi:hypothetical protein
MDIQKDVKVVGIGLNAHIRSCPSTSVSGSPEP